MRKAGQFLWFGVVLTLAAAACTKNSSSSPSAPTCSFSVAQPATTTFGADGGAGSMTVTAGSNCSWTAVSNASFITVTQGSSGSANGTVQFSVAANTGAERTGTLTVAGSTVSITQQAMVSTPAAALAAPVARSPIGGAEVNVGRPALVVDNSVAMGPVGTVTYRFELSDQNSFPADRTTAADGIAQGGGSTSWSPERDLPSNATFFWRARSTDGTVTSPFSNVESFRTGTLCTFTVSPNSLTASPGGGTSSVNVTATSSCSWTAVSNAAFITVTSGASGTGNGTVSLTFAQNSGAARTGTVTIAGQTVTVSQGANGVVASFRLLDPATSANPTTECRFRSQNSMPTTCVVESTSFTLGTSTLATYTWTVRYTYDTSKELTKSSPDPRFSFTDTCGQFSSTDDGVAQPLEVTLTVVDSLGNTATVRSGSGGQPALSVRLFTCGI